MSATKQLLEELRIRLRTTQPIVWIETDEPSRAAAVIRASLLAFAENAGKKAREGAVARDIFEHDVATGMYQLTDHGTLIKNEKDQTAIGKPVELFNVKDKGLPQNNFNPAAPWRFISDLLENGAAGSIFLLHNFAEIIDIPVRGASTPHARAMMRNALFALTGTLSMSSDVRSFKDSSRMIIATGRLPDPEIARSEILDTFDILRLDRPDDEELTELLRSLCSQIATEKIQVEATAKNAVAYNTDDKNLQFSRAARNVKGLTFFAAETATVRTFSSRLHLDPNELSKQRKTLIERCPGLVLVPPSAEFDWKRVKGVDRLERLVKQALRPDLSPRLRVNSMTCIGPAGTGKSMLAHALANYLGWPLIKCNIGQVFGKFIGDSQKGMAHLLATLDGVGECIVLFDEVDKQQDGLIGDGGQRGDSGVGAQVMQLLLSWEQDRTSRPGGALIVKTANRLSNLKSESQRAGRNDVTFFVDFPHRDVRREIALQYLADYEITLGKDDVEQMVNSTKMWSGAEIKELAKNVGRFGSLSEALQYVRPVFKMMPDDVNKMRDDAKKAGIPASSLSVDNEDDDELRAAGAAATAPRVANTGRLVTMDTE